MKAAAFGAVDWGTTSFRLWLIGGEGAVIAERRSAEGLAEAGRAGFAHVLAGHLAALGAADDLPIVICGMAGSRQGWVEARYLDVPARLEAIVESAVTVPDPKRRIVILPGLAQRDPARADVMRGEETQLLGASALSHGGADGLYCMPGTHSKWVKIESGRVTGFSTFMTGEIFAIVSAHSILAHALGPGDVDASDPAFAEAVLDMRRDPAALTNRLFSIRGSQLLFSEPPTTAKARLSGFLIGAELAGCGVDDTASVTLIASGRLRPLYEKALAAAGVAVQTVDADAAVRNGLTLAAASLGMIERLSA